MKNRLERYMEECASGILIFGAIFIAIGLGEFLYRGLNNVASLHHTSITLFPWVSLPAFVFAILAAWMVKTKMRFILIAFAVYEALAGWELIPGAIPIPWFINSGATVLMGATFVLITINKCKPLIRVSALIVGMSMICFKYYTLIILAQVWAKYRY